jgi:flagella basal body P-ring formation protein FlgA
MKLMNGALFFLTLATAAPAAATEVQLPAEVRSALDGALAVSGARVVPVSYTPSSGRACEATSATITRPVDGSGKFAVKLTGKGCSAWAWLKVDVWAQVPVTTRLVREGERLDDAVTFVERPITAGRTPANLSAESVAARSLARGQAVMPSDVKRSGGNAGDAVKVVVTSGSLAIETSGRIVACGRDRTCAVLPTGKHVEGRLMDGRLVVEIQ